MLTFSKTKPLREFLRGYRGSTVNQLLNQDRGETLFTTNE